MSLEVRVRLVARALARHGLVTAWGHASARIDADHFLVCASRPMGVIEPGEPGVVVPVRGPLPTGVLGEVRIHQQIYARRPDIGGVCRTMPPVTMALSTQRILPRPRHGVGAFVAGTRLWDDVRLLRDDALASALADTMGDAPALVMRGNGAVTVGTSIELAMAYAFFLEDTARVEQQARAIGETSVELTAEEIKARQVTSGGVIERLWQHMTYGDAEADALRDMFRS